MNELMKPSNRRWPTFLAAGVILCSALVIPATGSDPHEKYSQVNDGYGDFHKFFTDADDVEKAEIVTTPES